MAVPAICGSRVQILAVEERILFEILHESKAKNEQRNSWTTSNVLGIT